ncbi:MAG: HD domain-containing protein [Clostridia bacterium]
MDRYDTALEFATKKHHGQMRKDGVTPYIVHPVGVADLVAEFAQDNEYLDTMLVAALLHDTLEDTDTTYEEIYETFGDSVADIVDELTSDKEACKRIGKGKYLKIKMQNMSEEALTIKIADRLYNMRDVACMKPEKIQQFIDQNIEIIDWLRHNRANLTDTHIDLLKALEEEVNFAISELELSNNK